MAEGYLITRVTVNDLDAYAYYDKVASALLRQLARSDAVGDFILVSDAA